MIPKIIHQTAETKILSWEEERIARRIREMLPDWEYRLWDSAERSKLIQRCFPEFYSRYEMIPFGVAKADIARYAFLYDQGGFYFDTDYKLLKPIDNNILKYGSVIPIEHVWPYSVVPVPQPVELGNSIIGSEQGHIFWRDLVNHIFDNKNPENLTAREQIITVTGPAVLTEFYMSNLDKYPDIMIPEKNLFQPDIRWFALRSSANAETYGIHLHWGSWRNRDPLVAIRTFLRRKLNGLMS